MTDGTRYNKGKSELSMILEARHAMHELGSVLMFGKQKYDRGNWRKGLSHTEICDSLIRHLSAYLAGEDLDPESGLTHVGHVLANALFLAEMVNTRPEKDDRSQVHDQTKKSRVVQTAHRQGDRITCRRNIRPKPVPDIW